ncbi:MAG: allantoinase AllB [Acidobacteria bacterium]|nr:MAG: allantoinase AllB [Acidobacteriota bacterium]PYY23773.1 MAG: allantoinase AllB [Acidobacteriota bacterium]
MRASERVLRSNRVVLPEGIRAAAIVVRDGVIAKIIEHKAIPCDEVIDFEDSVIMPGIVDTHVHINEPGRTEWEGFETATMAAAAGGVTTLIDMPLNSIPATTTIAAFREKVAFAQGKLFVDVGFWGGMIPGNVAELSRMYGEGVFGFKCFLIASGVPEFEALSESELRLAFPELARIDALLLAHAELPGPIEDATQRISRRDSRSYSTWLASHPSTAEDQAIDLLIRLSKEYKARVHIVHLSSSAAAPIICAAKAGGTKLTVETCPHYLTIAAEEIPDGATQYKCAPPIRETANQERLWKALGDGTIDFVASDHSPAPPQTKCTDTGDYMRAWGGIASLQLTLPLLWTRAHKRGFGIEDIARWLCREPARISGLLKKGEIAAGRDADLVVWNPDQSFQVQAEKMFFRHKLTPYSGQTLFGIVQSTFLRGEEIYTSGDFPLGQRGHVLRRGEA